MRVAPRSEDSRVHLRAEAEAPPSVSTIEPDAPEAFFLGELANGDFERPRCFVEFHSNPIIISDWC